MIEIDLRGVRCPISWAKAKVALEPMARGTTATLLVDEERAVRDIPRAAEACGHHVLDVAPLEAGWRITIEV